MRMKHLATACCVALAAGSGAPAAAQVTGILTLNEVELLFKNGTVQNSGPNISGNSGSQSFGSGASYSSRSEFRDEVVTPEGVTPGVIFFKNGNASTGQFTRSKSTTSVDITFKNDGTETVTPGLTSQIIPAGFGIFVAPGTCPNNPEACNPADELLGNPPRNFNSFSPSGVVLGNSNVLASTAFTFNIYANDIVVYSLSGDLALVYGGVGNPNIIVENIGQAQSRLRNFRRQSDEGSGDFIGYVWDATNIDVEFAPGTLLAPGESATLKYETIVETFTGTNCLGGSRPGCSEAYGSFGDPIARRVGGATTTRIAASEAFRSFSDFAEVQAAPDENPGLLFEQFTFRIPVFSNGRLTLSLVPEPSSWAMLIAGFGLVGVTMRRRRRLTA